MRTLTCLLTAALLCWNGTALAEAPVQRPVVEAVFVLDTTGSMSGLLQAAKEKIWSIANSLAATTPTPIVRMGLVGYRDRGDDYVTKRTALSTDLDAVYKELMAFNAGGGGDGPESVNQALAEAVREFPWSQDPKTYKVIFLVGDAPPHMDYQDDTPYERSIQEAVGKGIIVNAIQCGSLSATTPYWTQIAKLGEGQYFSVAQSGGAILAATPFDGELAKLAHELDETRLYYGSKDDKREQAGRAAAAASIYKAASPAAQAQRAAWNASSAGKENFAGGKELVSDLEESKVALDEIKAEELPDTLRDLSPAERKAEIDRRQSRRRDVQQKIEQLSAKRQEYLESQVPDKAKKDSLEHKLFDAIKQQATKNGIKYEGGPRY